MLFFGYSTLDAILATGETAAAAGANMPGAADVAGVLSAELSGGLATAERLQAAGGLNLLDLLGAKLLATAVCVGAGLVGGTFAPSLFFGAVLGVTYQSIAGEVRPPPTSPDLPPPVDRGRP